MYWYEQTQSPAHSGQHTLCPPRRNIDGSSRFLWLKKEKRKKKFVGGQLNSYPLWEGDQFYRYELLSHPNFLSYIKEQGKAVFSVCARCNRGAFFIVWLNKDLWEKHCSLLDHRKNSAAMSLCIFIFLSFHYCFGDGDWGLIPKNVALTPNFFAQFYQVFSI